MPHFVAGAVFQTGLCLDKTLATMMPYTSCPVEWMKDIAISVAPLSDSFHPLNSDSFCVACARFGMCLRDSARAFVFPALFSQRYLSVVLETLLFPPVTSAVAAHKRELLCTT